ncbi:hypothetical protein ACSLUB_12350 [Bordetella hinzii]|uniref:hypothetical protein n=1 Tax=Bordetella hinzii TaxID=103855 RepID=UPI003F1BB29D
MNEVELNEFRIARLQAAVDHLSGGNKTDFGRRLGYKDGAFVRQMVTGVRPVTEKTIRAIEGMPGMAGWFSPSHQGERPPAASQATQWPFPRLPQAEYDRLTGPQKDAIEDWVISQVKAFRASPTVKSDDTERAA